MDAQGGGAARGEGVAPVWRLGEAESGPAAADGGGGRFLLGDDDTEADVGSGAEAAVPYERAVDVETVGVVVEAERFAAAMARMTICPFLMRRPLRRMSCVATRLVNCSGALSRMVSAIALGDGRRTGAHVVQLLRMFKEGVQGVVDQIGGAFVSGAEDEADAADELFAAEVAGVAGGDERGEEVVFGRGFAAGGDVGAEADIEFGDGAAAGVRVGGRILPPRCRP